MRHSVHSTRASTTVRHRTWALATAEQINIDPGIPRNPRPPQPLGWGIWCEPFGLGCLEFAVHSGVFTTHFHCLSLRTYTIFELKISHARTFRCAENQFGTATAPRGWRSWVSLSAEFGHFSHRANCSLGISRGSALHCCRWNANK